MELSYLRKHRSDVNDILHLLKDGNLSKAKLKISELDEKLARAIHAGYLDGTFRFNLVLQMLTLMSDPHAKIILKVQHMITEELNKNG